jgi:hypothetical protein
VQQVVVESRQPGSKTFATHTRSTKAPAAPKATTSATNSAANSATAKAAKAAKEKPTAARVANAYIRFAQDARQEIQEAAGGKLSIGEVSKRVSEKWKTLPEANKKVYRDAYEKAKAAAAAVTGGKA